MSAAGYAQAATMPRRAAKRAEEVRAAIRLRGVPDEVAEAKHKVCVLGEMA